MRHLFLALSLLVACTPKEEEKPPVPGEFTPKGEVLLTIDGHPLNEDQLKLAIDRLPPEQKQQLLESGQIRSMIEKMALGELFWHKAVEAGLQNDPEVQLRLALAQRDALAQAWIEKQLEATVTDEALKKAYDERGVQFSAPEARVRLILLTDEKLAKDLWGKLQAGGDFAALAKQHSLDKSSGAKGGEMGWVSKGQFTEALDAAIFGGTATGPVGPISMGEGWVIADVEERRGGKPFEEVKAQLAEVLKGEASEKLITETEKAVKIEWKKDPEPLFGGTAPAAAPAEGATPPAEGATPPAEGATPPAEGAAAPAEAAPAPAPGH